MKFRLFAAIIANLFAGAAFAQVVTDAAGNTSSVEFGLRGSNVNSQGNKAKFNEYRDMRDGVVGTIDINRKLDAGSTLNLWVENPGRDDQFWSLKGQTYGTLKYSIYYNEIVHNLSSGASTFYSGVGSTSLTINPSAGYPKPTVGQPLYIPDPLVANPSAWNSFDYSNKRKDTGAAVEWTTKTPWYFAVNANTEDRKGLKRVSSPSGVCLDKNASCFSAFGNVVEMPAPVDYKTSTASGEVGYNTRAFLMSLKYTQSAFKDNKQNLFWQNPYVTSQALMEATTQAPDSDYKNLALQGAFRELPLNSAVTYRANYAKFTNTVSLLTGLALPSSGVVGPAAPVYSTAQVLPAGSSFQGNIVYRSASLAWTAQPMPKLDTRVYYNWTDKTNKSQELTYTGSGAGAPTAMNERFQYRKNDIGMDLHYRLRPDTKLAGGYELIQLSRERVDFNETRDQRLYGEVKYTGWDWGSGRVKYQRLQRRSHFVNGNAGVNSADPAFMDRYISRYDANGNDQDMLRLVLDANPAPLVDLGAEYIYKSNKYKPGQYDPILGRTKDKRNELYLTAAWGKVDGVRLSAYADMETVKYDSYHRNPRVGAPSPLGSYDPTTAPSSNTTGTGWNWDQNQKDRNWAIGAGVEWPLKQTLKLVGSLGYERTDGTMNFASQTNALGVPFGNDTRIDYWDSYKKRWLSLKAVYRQSKQLDLTLGFVHEGLDYRDNQFMNYTNIVRGASGEPNTYLTGYANNPNYSANMLYVTGKYAF